MPTFLFNSIIVGPIYSRRMGQSLGVNLLPTNSKLCNFDCIYCECGWNADSPMLDGKAGFNPMADVLSQLEEKLQELKEQNKLPDSITFSGNGEPTMHPQFDQIVEGTIRLRNQYAPDAQVSVLTNATMAGRPKVMQALKRVDRAMLKLDAGIDSTLVLINKPQFTLTVEQLLANMQPLGNKLMVQSMFLRGKVGEHTVDNTTPHELEQWLKAIKLLQPREVMLYTIDRDTPAKDLQKISKEDLQAIADRVKQLGIQAKVYA